MDPYAAPKSMGIFRMIESPRDTAAASVAKRIVANHDIYKVCFLLFFLFQLFANLQQKVGMVLSYTGRDDIHSPKQTWFSSTCVDWITCS